MVSRRVLSTVVSLVQRAEARETCLTLIEELDGASDVENHFRSSAHVEGVDGARHLSNIVTSLALQEIY